jgi:predicted O-linked N-acetylglucosamine transferase (SPINDLY family)
MQEIVTEDRPMEDARSFFHQKDYRNSIKCLAKLRHCPEYALHANTNISSCLLLMGLVRSAKKFIDRALHEDPKHLPALTNSAEVLIAEKDFSSAASSFRAIISMDEQSEKAYLGLARALSGMKEHDSAMSVLTHLLAKNPTSYDGYLLKGELLANQRQYIDSVRCLAKALELEPEREDCYTLLSIVMFNVKDYENSLRYLDRSLSVNPASLVNICRKAQVLLALGRWKEARLFYQAASERNPTSASLFLNSRLLLPAIPLSAQEIEEARYTFIDGITHAEQNPRLKLKLGDDLLPHTFALAYHNQNDRHLLERYHNLLRRLTSAFTRFAINQAEARIQPKIRSSRLKIRIAFVSKFFSGHSNALAFEGLIRCLDRSRFEVILIHLDGSEKDEMRDSLDSACDMSVQLNAVYSDVCFELRNLDLDILFFTDIGMNGLDCLIPFLKCAPIQMTGWGIPHTSGLHEIDFYLSSEGLELSGTESDYTETLIKLPVALPCCFLNKSLDFAPLSREYFLLSPDDFLFGCLQSLHKLHPDFDSILEQIALANPNAGFVFVEDPIAARTKLFLERLATNAPTVRERCVTLALMTRQEYHAISHCLDLLIDPIYYGSGVTFFEAAFVGTPIITLEGTNLRSRVVACGYREMGISCPPIASSPQELIHLATALANDLDARNRLRSEILEKNHKIFNRLDYVTSFEQFCFTTIQDRREKEASII